MSVLDRRLTPVAVAVGALWLGLAVVAAAAPLPSADPPAIADRIVVPDGWALDRSGPLDDGASLGLLRRASGEVVDTWWRATHEALLTAPDGSVVVIDAHRFDTPAHAREVWLGVLRLAEEPDLALAPRVLEQAPDTLVFGAGSLSTAGGEEQYLTEEAHRLVGQDIVVVLHPYADVTEPFPSEVMQELLAVHQTVFPRDQFDLPEPGGGGLDARTLILLVVLGIAGSVLLVSTLVLWRRRREP